MRPYKFRIRLSSKRLNVTRPGKGPAAALRAAARLSLGSAPSDIELMERLLYDFRPDPFFGKTESPPSGVMPRRHDRANGGGLQEGRGRGAQIRRRRIIRDPWPGKKCSVTGSLGKS